jgi:hypothetical protein
MINIEEKIPVRNVLKNITLLMWATSIKLAWYEVLSVHMNKPLTDAMYVCRGKTTARKSCTGDRLVVCRFPLWNGFPIWEYQIWYIGYKSTNSVWNNVCQSTVTQHDKNRKTCPNPHYEAIQEEQKYSSTNS